MEIDVFWSFRSPRSYLAAPRLRLWQARYEQARYEQGRYELTVNFRPAYPIAIRIPEFFHQVPAQMA